MLDSSSSLDLNDDQPESRPSSRLSSFSWIDSPSKASQLCLSSNGEFKQHYDSIMYSTNLVDSCVEALNDITMDGSFQLRDQQENLFGDERRMSVQAASNQRTVLNNDQVMAFERWLTVMESRLAGYPTLSDIYAMEAEEMHSQYEVHSRIFNEIVAQTCIVGNSISNDHRALAERYHLLYLRAYEVLLLLEGVPFDNERENYSIDDDGDDENDDNGTEDGITRLDDTHDDIDRFIDGDSVDEYEHNTDAFVCFKRSHTRDAQTEDCEPCSPVKARIPHVQPTSYDSGDDDMSSSNGSNGSSGSSTATGASAHNEPNKNAAPYDNNLVSLFDNMDELYETLKFDERDCGMQTSPEVLRCAVSSMHSTSSPIAYPYQRFETSENVNNTTIHSYFEQDISVYEESKTVTTTTVTTDVVHNKVYHWLNSRTIDASVVEVSDVRSNFVYIYKAKSESNMDAAAPIRQSISDSSSNRRLSTSSLLDKSIVKSEMGCDSQAHDANSIGDAMHWDAYQPDLLLGQQQPPYQMDDWDACSMTDAEWHLCFFGENYEYYVDASDAASSVSDTVSEHASFDLDHEVSMKHLFESTKTVSDLDAMASTATLHTMDSERILKRRRRRHNRRMKKMRHQQQTTTSMASSMSSAYSEPSIAVTTSTSNYSSIGETMMTSTASMQSLPSLTTSSSDASTRSDTPSIESTKSILYNSDDQSFEVFAADQTDGTPIRRKVNELKPEDFHDIIQMCRNNIDCVITVLGAEPNRVLTVNYCEKMRRQRATAKRAETVNDELCYCSEQHKLMEMATADALLARNCTTDDDGDCCRCSVQYTCLCSWIAQTIAMIINFLLDCWNVFRNMRLYTYLGKVLRGFFAATKEVTKRINTQSKYSKALTCTANAC